MTSGQNRVLDELAKLVTDAAGAAQGVRREVETALRSQGERVLNTLDVVQREDFEAVREMAIKARAENSALLAESKLSKRVLRNSKLILMPNRQNRLHLPQNPKIIPDYLLTGRKWQNPCLRVG